MLPRHAHASAAPPHRDDPAGRDRGVAMSAITLGRAAAQKLRTLVVAASDLFPLTPLGVLIMLGCALGLVRFGVARVDLLLLVIGGVGLAVGALTTLTTVITALVLWHRLGGQSTEAPLQLECSYAARTGFSLPSLWFVPFVKLSWTWRSPEADVSIVRIKRRLHEEVVPRRRAQLDRITRRMEVGDAFGFTRVRFTATELRGVRVTPSVGALKNMHVVRSIAGGDSQTHPAGPPEGERADMRHYAPGDPIKFVLWKVFARTRQLVVRTPERAISPVRQTVAYLVTGPSDEPAAGAARVAVDSGALGSEWSLGADGQDAVARSAPQALEVLARSSNHPDALGGVGLQRFLDTATPGGTSRAVVFVPARPGPWLDRVVAAARARSSPQDRFSPVEFVVCTDGISRAPKRSWLERATTDDRTPLDQHATPQEDLARVIAALGAARARVLIVDRAAGRVFGAEQHRSEAA